MNFKVLHIYGAGGHGRVVADSAIRAGIPNVVFVDDQPKGVLLQGWPVVGTQSISDLVWRQSNFIVAIGVNSVRAEIFDRLRTLGGIPVSVLDPFSSISRHAIIGPGSFVAPGAIINTSSQIGSNCIINTAACIDHDCVLGNHTQVSPHACLAGNVHLGEETMIGIGATIVPGRTIGRRAIIGAGAVVTRDLPENVRAWGVPARVISGYGDSGKFV